MKKGEKILIPSVPKITARLSWEDGDEIECDLMAFMLGDDGLIPSRWDIIFYNVHSHESHSVKHMGIKRRDGLSFDEIYVRPDLVPDKFKSILFLSCVYEASERSQSLKSVKNPRFCLSDSISGSILCEYHIIPEDDRSASVIIGRLSRANSGWIFEAVGAEDRQQLVGVIATRYGMRVDWRSDYKDVNADKGVFS